MQNQKKILVKKKYIFGNEQFWPECDQAKLFAKMAGTKTLTLECLEIIKQLGYAVQQVI